VEIVWSREQGEEDEEAWEPEWGKNLEESFSILFSKRVSGQTYKNCI
jgi:hypothetical protein